jgi:D-aminopeptidase
MRRTEAVVVLVLCLLPFPSLLAQTTSAPNSSQPRARDLGIPFDGTPGAFNAITDVPGVEVGYKTLISGEGRLVVGKGPVRTGVTAILPRGTGNMKSVFAGYFAGNGNGDMTGTHWIEVTAQDTWDALNAATGGSILEGNVGGGTGMICNGFKGGTGTSSRKVGDYTVGVLVQCNYGGSQGLRVAGIPVAREMKLQKPCVEKKLDPPVLLWDGKPAPVCEGTIARTADGARAPEMGSIIVIVATNAPLTPDQLKRLARRVSVGLGRVGAIEGDESGDIFLSFSTANPGADEGNSAEPPFTEPNAKVERMQSWKMDPMFTAVVQATEESVINVLIAAKTMVGADYWVIPAIPHDELQQVLRKHGMLK